MIALTYTTGQTFLASDPADAVHDHSPAAIRAACNRFLERPQRGDIASVRVGGALVSEADHDVTSISALASAIAQGKDDRLPPDHKGRCYLRDGCTEITELTVDHIEAIIIDSAIPAEIKSLRLDLRPQPAKVPDEPPPVAANTPSTAAEPTPNPVLYFAAGGATAGMCAVYWASIFYALYFFEVLP